MDYSIYEFMDMPDPNFPIKVALCEVEGVGNGFQSHWHEHIEILYLVKGSAAVTCGTKTGNAVCGDIIFVNGSEPHSLVSKDDYLSYYCIIFDLPLLMGDNKDTCNTKYLEPVLRSRIVFSNIIHKDADCTACIENMIAEFNEKGFAYEPEMKSITLHLLALLLRRHIDQTLSYREYAKKIQTLHRFEKLFRYIELHYPQPLTTSDCAAFLNISLSHFCHLFKEVTGEGLTDYLNRFRIGKARILLQDTDMNITQIALAVGFSDAGYFTRIFRKITLTTPTKIRRQPV